jgi:hypothetical protein
MACDLLINAAASATGQWCRTEPPAHKTWPFRVMFTDGATAWSVGSVILEELIGGVPLSPGPIIQDNPGLLTAGSQTGTVRQLGTFPPGSPDFEIDMPVEYIRARTDGSIVGNVSVRLLEAA